MSEHTGDSYDSISKKYGEKVENDERAPYNAYYERPAMLSLLPPVDGRRVLDAGCGTGKLAEMMAQQGAIVTAFDYNPEFVAWTRQRLGERGTVLQADLSQPLSFISDGSFDLVTASLVMHYLKDWVPALREIHRVLAPDGVLVFSTHHPLMVWRHFQLENYHAEKRIEDEWEVGKVSYFHHSLDYMSRALWDSGFTIERLHEPLPGEEFKRVDPKGYEKLMKLPWFLVIRARKQG